VNGGPQYICFPPECKSFLAKKAKTRQKTVSNADYSLDITSEVCPLTFVKTKLLLEKMAVGEVASIRLSAGEPLTNLPRSLRDQGHAVLDLTRETGDTYRLLVRKGTGPR
jgi:TusA-related sulfurtransferase